MISVVIRNKNQASALSFLLQNLTERYAADISEIIVIDNISTDESKAVCQQFGAKCVTIEKFSYGGSANLAALEAKCPIVVLFSAHSYPVSHDFFRLIREKFEANSNLAGLRCLHSTNDYRNFINQVTAQTDPNKSGLIFSGSAFSKDVWEKYPFREDVATFEDKEWTVRVLNAGFEIDFVPSIFHYEIQRTPKQQFFRYKNDVIGNYQLWHQDVNLSNVLKGFLGSLWDAGVNFLIAIKYAFLRFLFLIRFMSNKPKRF